MRRAFSKKQLTIDPIFVNIKTCFYIGFNDYEAH